MLDHERVLIYCRTLQSDDTEDLDTQESQCWDYMAEEYHGEWEVVLTIKEVGNGLSLNRPGLQAILRPLERLWSVEPQPLLAPWAPEERPFDVVLVWSPDRVAASDVLFNDVHEKLGRASVRFDFVYDEPGLMEDAQQDEEEARRRELSRLQTQAEIDAEIDAELEAELDEEEAEDGDGGGEDGEHGEDGEDGEHGEDGEDGEDGDHNT